MLECTYGAHKQHANFESKEGSSKEAETRGARDGKTLEATSQTKKKKKHTNATPSQCQNSNGRRRGKGLLQDVGGDVGRHDIPVILRGVGGEDLANPLDIVDILDPLEHLSN